MHEKVTNQKASICTRNEAQLHAPITMRSSQPMFTSVRLKRLIPGFILFKGLQSHLCLLGAVTKFDPKTQVCNLLSFSELITSEGKRKESLMVLE